MGDRTWSEDAKRVLDFLYRFWAEHRRPPDVSTVARGTGFGFRAIRRAYRELQAGFAVVADDSRLNLSLQKVTPFSATPTPVCTMDIDGIVPLDEASLLAQARAHTGLDDLGDESVWLEPFRILVKALNDAVLYL